MAILEPYRDQLPAEVFTSEFTVPVTNGDGNNRAQLREGIRILEEAGYKTGEDGIRVDPKTGERLSFEIIDNQQAFERWTLPFIKNLKRMGIEASFRVVDDSQLVNLLNSFDFDMTIHSFGQSLSPGNEQREFWGSEKATMEGSRNMIGIQSPVGDALIEQLITASSRDDLIMHTRALDRVLLNGYYVVPQWYIDKWRLAYSKSLAHPETLSPKSPNVTDTWWKKPE